MGVIAVFVWLATAGAGLYLLAVWLIEYDRDVQKVAATRLPVPVISAHALLAIVGLGVWGGALFLGDHRLAWITIAILGGVATLGLTMAARWLPVYRGTSSPRSRAAAAAVPPERHFPLSVVIGHGVLGVSTITLVVLATLETHLG